jgi:hypothetical protein
LITGILELKYDPEPERTFWKRRRAQRLAKSSNLNTEEEPTTKAMRDEPNGRDYGACPAYGACPTDNKFYWGEEVILFVKF